MANKIYLGEIEVANTGGGGGGEGYVSDSSFNEMTKVAASALLDLKGFEDNIEAFDEKIEGHVEVIDTQIQGLQNSKADSSTVYDKSERDKTDKVAAAAIASLDGRVSALEQGGGGGGGITPSQLDASLKAYTYDKAHIDASIDAIEPGISYAELDASLKEYAYSKSYIDTSVQALDASIVALDASIVALDASALAFDASIKELAEGGGGGGGESVGVVLSVNPNDSTKKSVVLESLYNSSNFVNTSTGNNNVILCAKSSYAFEKSYADGDNCFIEGYACYSNSSNVHVEGYVSSCNAKMSDNRGSHIEGYESIIYTAGGAWGVHLEGYSNAIGGSEFSNTKSYMYGCHVEGKDNKLGGPNNAQLTGIHVEGASNIIKVPKSQNFVIHIEGSGNSINSSFGTDKFKSYEGDYAKSVHVEGYHNKASHSFEHAEGFFNNSLYSTDVSVGSPNKTLSTIGNGVQDSSRHNAFEVRQSGDIYISDVSAAGEYYEKPMINLQQKIYELEARLAALENS